MAVRKDDPMYYRNKVKDLIKEAHECEIWGVKLPEDEREESYE